MGIHCSCEYIMRSVLYTAHALTSRDEKEVDSIALDEVAQIIIRTLDEVSIQWSYYVISSDGCVVFCSSLSSVHCTREGSAKDFTTLHCPIVYPQRRGENITVSTDEGELV